MAPVIDISEQVDPLLLLSRSLRAKIPKWQAKHIGRAVGMLRRHHFRSRDLNTLISALYLCREKGITGSEAARKAWRVLRMHAERFADAHSIASADQVKALPSSPSLDLPFLILPRASPPHLPWPLDCLVLISSRSRSCSARAAPSSALPSAAPP